jgi:hypothetical protein
MPSPPAFVQGKPDCGVTKIRNITLSHWRRWLGRKIARTCCAGWRHACIDLWKLTERPRLSPAIPTSISSVTKKLAI